LTPLLDAFRRGEVAREIRALAAQGALTLRAPEQLALLVLLTADPDPEVARAAEATVANIPAGSVAAVLARPEISDEIRSFFVARGIEPAAAPGAEDDALLADTAALVESIAPADETPTTAMQRISGLGVAPRIMLAMKGTREERAILIRDPNTIVCIAVLSSPRMTETEIESFARMSSVSGDILRVIANTRTWIKKYSIVLALVKNPKTPLPVSMNLLSRLNDKDMRMLSTDRNIPDLLRITARKKIVFDR
jgi:hypothetical protein